jgi:hypothetical protein
MALAMSSTQLDLVGIETQPTGFWRRHDDHAA